MNLKEILDREEGMVRDLLKKHDHIITHIMIEKTVNGRNILVPIFISANREQIKMTKNLTNYSHGSLEKEFKNGNKGIQDVIILQVYSKHGKLMRILEKKMLKQIEKDVDEFDGYLAVSDVQRVFWDEKEDKYGNKGNDNGIEGRD
jgi:delta-aminolevulinic acid dehydratase/porphobilinogen synthase